MEPTSWKHSQLKVLLPTLLRIYIPTFCALWIVVLVRLLIHVPIQHLTRDTTSVLEAPFYIGLLSNVGILLWCSASSICLFSAAIVRKTARAGQMRLFLLFSGLLSAVFLFDDLLLLHEDVYPRYLHVPEPVTLAGYGIVTLLYLVGFRKTILKTEFLILFLAFVFFGLSIIVDAISPERLPGRYLFEDGSKLFGIIHWVTYFARLCLQQVKSATSSRRVHATETEYTRSDIPEAPLKEDLPSPSHAHTRPSGN